MIRHLALFLNFFCPGLGSLALGKWRIGLAQLALVALALLAFRYSVYSMYAIIVLIAVWGWGLFTAEYNPRTGGVLKTPRA